MPLGHPAIPHRVIRIILRGAPAEINIARVKSIVIVMKDAVLFRRRGWQKSKRDQTMCGGILASTVRPRDSIMRISTDSDGRSN